MPDTPATRPPLALHEAGVDRYQPRDPRTQEVILDPDLTAASAAMKIARGAAEQLAAAADALARDPSRTPATAGIELRRLAPVAGERATKALDVAGDRLRRAIVDIGERTAPAGPKTAEAVQLAAEVRAAVAKMSAADRSTFLAEATAAGDELTIGAVIRAPGILSGLSAPAQEALRAGWRAARHPAEAARAERLSRALAVVEGAGEAAVAFVRAIVANPAAELAEARQGEADRAIRAVKGAGE
jgi:hypothetical protein